MTYHSEHDRHRAHDVQMRAGLRPHEFPETHGAGIGGLAVLLVLVALIGLFIVFSALGGREATTDGAPIAVTGGAAPVTVPVD